MMKSKHSLHKSKVLLVMSMLLGSACFMPAPASAMESLFSKSRFSQLLDGDVQLAPIGQRGGLHMTFGSPTESRDAFNAVHADAIGGSSGVHLTVKMPWK